MDERERGDDAVGRGQGRVQRGDGAAGREEECNSMEDRDMGRACGMVEGALRPNLHIAEEV